jgi:hypothetical protein
MTLFRETIFLICNALRDWRFHRICLSASDLKYYYTSASLPLRHLRQTCQLQDLGSTVLHPFYAISHSANNKFLFFFNGKQNMVIMQRACMRKNTIVYAKGYNNKRRK